MKHFIICLLALLSAAGARGQNYPTSSKTLKNGLKVIVCEKPGNDFVYVQLWYRTGSKDEASDSRGMAHMFEHMMFRGTTRYPGDTFTKMLEHMGGEYNASTHSDFTEYHEFIPKQNLEQVLDMEADRMANLKVTQEVLNTERQVVGEEFRNNMNSWANRMVLEEYKLLYPEGHPYTVNTIGNLDEITAFTAEQCIDFYNKYYSPNNAFLIVTGNIKSEEVYAMAEKYFGPLTKQLNLKPKENVPDLVNWKPRKDDMQLDQMLQIYSYTIPFPAISSPDYHALNMLCDLVFLSGNSLLNESLVKKGHQVYGIEATEESRFYEYPSMQSIDFFMGAAMGNLKVKKQVKATLDRIKQEGLPQSYIDGYVNGLKNKNVQNSYQSEYISNELGFFELYFHDYTQAAREADAYAKVTPEDLKRVANTYFADERLHVINIKPE